MSTSDLKLALFREIADLPESRFLELYNLILSFLKEDETSLLGQNEEIEKTKREFGSLKGAVVFMSEDFDEELEDFEEYMR